MRSIKFILLVSIFTLFFSACKKDKKTAEEVEEIDRINPTLVLNGSASMEIINGETTEDPGASAVDNKDGDLSSSVVSNWKEKVNVNKNGIYEVVYSVKDNSGNQSTVKRKITVKLIASCYDGAYNSYTIYSGGTTPVFSATVSGVFNSNQLVIYPFVGFDPTLIVDISGPLGDQLSFSQTNGGSTLIGTGTVSEDGNVITLNYRLTSGAFIRDNQQILTRSLD